MSSAAQHPAEPEAWVAVFTHDGGPVQPDEWGFVRSGPFLAENYLNACTREIAELNLRSKGGQQHGGGRVARLDFTELDEAGPYVLVAGHDGVQPDRGPLVWEHVLHDPSRHTRDAMRRSAATLERRYGACRIARLVFDEPGPQPRLTEQAAFDRWVAETAPSGGCEAVLGAWLRSTARAEWLDDAAP